MTGAEERADPPSCNVSFHIHERQFHRNDGDDDSPHLDPAPREGVVIPQEQPLYHDGGGGEGDDDSPHLDPAPREGVVADPQPFSKMSKRKSDLNISFEARQAGDKANEKQSKTECGSEPQSQSRGLFGRSYQPKVDHCRFRSIAGASTGYEEVAQR